MCRNIVIASIHEAKLLFQCSLMSDVEDHGDDEENRSRCLYEYDGEYEIDEEENRDSEESESGEEVGDEGVESGIRGLPLTNYQTK